MTALAPRDWFLPLVVAFQSVKDRLIRSNSMPRAPANPAHQTGFVSLVGAGPGAADLITMRGLARLQRADVVYYDRLADPALLDHAPRHAARIYVGKAAGCHAMPQARINALLVQAALAGKQVVRLKCGDPGIFARGAEEADALTAAAVAWEIVPGVTSACAAAASARSFLTERGQTERLILATGHLRHEGRQDWSGSAQPGTTLGCYMGVAQVQSLAQDLRAAGWPEGAPVQVVSKAQTPDEQIFECRLNGLEALCAQHSELSPAMLLIRWPLELGATAEQTARIPGAASLL